MQLFVAMVLSTPKWCILCSFNSSFPGLPQLYLQAHQLSWAIFDTPLSLCLHLFICDSMILTFTWRSNSDQIHKCRLTDALGASLQILSLALSSISSDLVQEATGTESAFTSISCNPHFKANLMPLITSSSTTLIWATSSFFRSQAASSAVTFSRRIPVLY